MMAAILESIGDSDVVFGLPPVARTWDLWAAIHFIVIIFRLNHFFLTSATIRITADSALTSCVTCPMVGSSLSLTGHW